MADIGEAITARLLSWPALTALVGDRISPNRLTQAEDLPAVIWIIDGGDGDLNVSDGPSGTVNEEIRTHAMGRTVEEAIQVGAAIQGALAGWTDSDALGLNIAPVLRIGGRRLEKELIGDGDDQPVHVVVQNYSFWYA